MTKRNGLLIVLAILVIAASAACGDGKKADTTPQPKLAEPIEAAATEAAQPTKVASNAPQPTAALEPTKAAAIEPTPVPTPEEETLSLNSRAAGLDKLKSYRAKWSAEWKSTEEGQTKTGSWNWEEDFTAEPAKARHLLWRTNESTDPSKETLFELWRIGDTMYMKAPDSEECIVISSEETAKNMEQASSRRGRWAASMRASMWAVRRSMASRPSTTTMRPSSLRKVEARSPAKAGWQLTAASW